MQPMRMHRSEFPVNLIPPSQVSIKTPKNNNMHVLISKRVRVGPIVVFQSIILSIKTMISHEENFDSHFACFYLSPFYRTCAKVFSKAWRVTRLCKLL